MTPIKVQLENVTYNAATQAFEARAILHDNNIQHSYACMIDAPITLAFDDAAGRLSRQAFRLHRLSGQQSRPQVGARLLSSTVNQLRAAA